MTIHVAMNIAAKDMMYLEARRVVGPGGADLPRDFRTGDYLRDCPPNSNSQIAAPHNVQSKSR
jgi:hypothetical protein